MATESTARFSFPELPEGTVTFLFTDIEGSTQLLQQLRDSYTTLLADQRRILRKVFAHWGGNEVDTQGDAFFVAFSRATQAVSAAAEMQRKLAEHSWPEGVVVRVRIGIHTGEPWTGEEGYVGIDVHRAARIAHVGHGGQVLLSETTAALVIDELPHGVDLVDLGRHLLKDIHRPEHIRQLSIEGLPVEFPPLKSLEALPVAEQRQKRVVGESPYRGLAAFREGDAAFFFGREVFTERLNQAVHTQPMVAVIVGSSGSGKSSVVFAGLLPRLREEGEWTIVQLRPGEQPFHALASALLPFLDSNLPATEKLVETRRMAAALAGGELQLYDVLEEIKAIQNRESRVLLVVDQFEELYTLCPDIAQQLAFVKELLRVVEAVRLNRIPPFVILLTLRADFMGQALEYRPFADTLQEATLLMGPMTRQELHMAIERPAEMQGGAFETGLVERILDDVGEKPGNLPLLEFTLTQLWEGQSDGWLTHALYEAIGSVEGALAAYADQVYTELTPKEQEQTPRVLAQLVKPGEGTEDTRRVATRVEFEEQGWKLIQYLADRRLVVTGRDATGRETAEVVHEALIQKWGRFQEWIDADRDFRTWQERLRGNLKEWLESDRDEGALLGGAPLAVAQNWLAERGDYLSSAESEYVQQSLALQGRKEKERQRRRQWTFLGLTAGLVVAILLSAVAFNQRQNSQRQAAILLAGQAETELANGYHDRAVLLALAALENFPYTTQAEHALGQAVSYNRALLELTPHQSAVTSIAWSPDGRLVASSGSSDNNVHIWDAVSGESIQVIDMPKGITGNMFDMALHVQWTPDGDRLLTLTGDRYTLGSQDYDLMLWDASSGGMISSAEIANQAEPESGELVVTFVNYPTGAAAAIAKNSGRLATLGGDDTAIIWDTAWQKPELVLSGHKQSVNSVDWSSDETMLVTASLDGTAIVWDTQTGAKVYTLTGHEGRVNLALWSPDGNRIATAGEDGAVRFWARNDGELVRSIESNAGAVTSLAWAPNSVRLVSGHEDGSLRIWEIATGKLLETLRGNQGTITDLKWSPVDNRLVSGDGSGNVRIWDAAPSTAWRVYPPQVERGGDWSVQGASWSSNGRYLTLAGGDVIGFTEPASFEIWDVQENRLLMQNLGDKLNYMGLEADFSPDDKAILYLGFPGFPDFSGLASAYIFDATSGQIIKTFTPEIENFIRWAAWSSDGSQVATGLFNNTIIIWDYQTGEKLITLVHGDDQSMFVNYVEWSPDGTKFASASDDSIARVWDAHTWEPLFTVHHQPPTFVTGLAWSPDSKRLLTLAGNDERGAQDHTARVWDGETGKELLAFSGHTKSVWPGDWSPNGKRIATFGNDGNVRIWDAFSGVELLTLSVPALYGGASLWSPDGQHLAILGLETLISVWRVWQTTDELVAYAKDCCVMRQLSAAERQQFGLP